MSQRRDSGDEATELQPLQAADGDSTYSEEIHSGTAALGPHIVIRQGLLNREEEEKSPALRLDDGEVFVNSSHDERIEQGSVVSTDAAISLTNDFVPAYGKPESSGNDLQIFMSQSSDRKSSEQTVDMRMRSDRALRKIDLFDRTELEQCTTNELKLQLLTFAIAIWYLVEECKIEDLFLKASAQKSEDDAKDELSSSSSRQIQVTIDGIEDYDFDEDTKTEVSVSVVLDDNMRRVAQELKEKVKSVRRFPSELEAKEAAQVDHGLLRRISRSSTILQFYTPQAVLERQRTMNNLLQVGSSTRSVFSNASISKVAAETVFKNARRPKMFSFESLITCCGRELLEYELKRIALCWAKLDENLARTPLLEFMEDVELTPFVKKSQKVLCNALFSPPILDSVVQEIHIGERERSSLSNIFKKSMLMLIYLRRFEQSLGIAGLCNSRLFSHNIDNITAILMFTSGEKLIQRRISLPRFKAQSQIEGFARVEEQGKKDGPEQLVKEDPVKVRRRALLYGSVVAIAVIGVIILAYLSIYYSWREISYTAVDKVLLRQTSLMHSYLNESLEFLTLDCAVAVSAVTGENFFC
jgi:hypothetical protein